MNGTGAPNETAVHVSPCDGSSSETSLWYVGVILSILASIWGNLGVNTQKYSMMREEVRVEETGSKPRPYILQPFWSLGLFLVVAGSLGDFAALGFAAQSLITPVGA